MQTTRLNVNPRGAKQRKKENLQKYFANKICDGLFYLGVGNFWYEDRNRTNIQQYVYNIYAIIINIYLFGNVINVYLAHLRSDLTNKEKEGLIPLTVSYTSQSIKLILLYVMKKRIKILLKRFFEEKREFARLDLDIESVKKAKKYCAVLVVTASLTMILFIVNGIIVHFKEGILFHTVTLYFPTPSHSGLLINILRALAEMHGRHLITIMICIDCLCTCCLVFTGYKFRTLKVFFNGLGQKYQADPEINLEVLEGKYIKDFEAGILFHKEILWCCYYVQYALGYKYSLHIVEGICFIAHCLVKLVTLERNVSFLAAYLFLMVTVSIVTGSYMFSAGDIIYEAEEIPIAIFNSGWERTKLSKKIRNLVVTTLIVSQVPVYMTAFGLFVLSYDNFIAVVQCSYSFFAVMY